MTKLKKITATVLMLVMTGFAVMAAYAISPADAQARHFNRGTGRHRSFQRPRHGGNFGGLFGGHGFFGGRSLRGGHGGSGFGDLIILDRLFGGRGFFF